jgi:hypothetical protein
MVLKKKKTNEVFFLTFVGEFVSLLTSMVRTESVTAEEGTVEETIPLVFQGYLLDADDDFFYLGDTPNEVNKVVKRAVVNALEITRQKDSFSDILDNVDIPDNKKDFN